MASIHLMTMRVCNQLAGGITKEGVDYAERALNKLARTFATQVETLKKYRTGGEQKVTVQHVSVMPTPSLALQYKYIPLDEGSVALTFTGPIVSGDFDRFRHVSTLCPLERPDQSNFH
jgi:hypothetical protein